MKKVLKYALVPIILCGAGVVFMVASVQLSYLSRIHSPSEIPSLPHSSTAIVLGASVKQDGTPSDALRDRLLVGVQLYKAKTVDRLLLTGDDGEFHADEVDVMKRFVEQQGVPEDAIITDDHGYRTYESCKRAKQEFHLDRAIIVTQRFHIGRAVYLCNALGVDTDGVTSDLQTYVRNAYFWARDLTASVKAWIDIHVIPPDSPVSTV